MKATGALLLSLLACAVLLAAAAPAAPQDAVAKAASPLRRLLGSNTLGILSGIWGGNSWGSSYGGYGGYGYNPYGYGGYNPYYGGGYGGYGGYNRYSGYGRRYGYGWGKK